MQTLVTFQSTCSMSLGNRITATQDELTTVVIECIGALNTLGAVFTAYDVTSHLRSRLPQVDIPHVDPSFGSVSFGLNQGVRATVHAVMNEMLPAPAVTKAGIVLATVITGDYTAQNLDFGSGKTAIAYVPVSTGRIAVDTHQQLPQSVRNQLAQPPA